MTPTPPVVIDPAPFPSCAHLPLLVAPCGCSYRGRFYSTRGCARVAPDWSGNRATRHMIAAKRRAMMVASPTGVQP